ncbi:MAG: DNA gyrase C-terminal beta-propeller domain-containing protein, partial [Myxococcota bacterium]
PRPSGLIALSIDDGDSLTRVAVTTGDSELLVATRMGMAIRFKEEDVRPMGRTARGVRALNLKKDGDAVVGMAILNDEAAEILTISELGYGKRTKLDEYRVQGRGGSGIINMKTSSRTGEVASARAVAEDDEIMVVTNRGMMIRTAVKQISTMSRSTQGVRVITMSDGEERVASVALIAEKDEDE